MIRDMEKPGEDLYVVTQYCDVTEAAQDIFFTELFLCEASGELERR